ncbi:MAG: hypothetical protein PHS73_00410 [Candidatus Peribacteraceae bacterium]|nr:hypothetical protein [Candidatus Peribacteraceae bacterium]
MRVLALVSFGIILSLGGAVRPLQAEGSVAQKQDAAMEQTAPHGVIAARLPRTPVRQPRTSSASSAGIRSAIAVFPAVIDQPDIQLKHKIIATEVFNLLPVSCQGSLKHFYVRYEKPERRGLAGKSTVIIDGTLPDEEFRAVLVHEMLGHVFDLGCMTGSAQAGASTFRDGADPVYNDDPSFAFYRISWTDAKTKRSDAVSADFVSGYAASDPFEDMAESVAYYMLQNAAFRSRARENAVLAVKLKWLETFFPVNQPVALGQTTGAGSVPWDVTKLPYTWNINAAGRYVSTKVE